MKHRYQVRDDLTWIQQLMEVGDELGGIELPIPEDTEATAADFSEGDEPA